MESDNIFSLDSFPIEKEFRVLSVKRRLHELSREDLEEFLSESLVIMTKLAHLVEQMRDHIQDLEGKTE
jgi:hypothetical protein